MVLSSAAGYKSGGILKRFGKRTSSIILVVAFFAITAPQFYRSIQASNGLQTSWLYEPIWRDSADCARKTSAILVLCRDGNLIPISDETPGDDLGHALSLELFSMITQKAIAPEHISILNSIVNYVGIIVLALLLFTLRLPFVALLVLTIGPRFSDIFHRLTPHPSQFGVACMAAILPFAIVYFFDVKSDRRMRWVWLGAGLLCLVLAALFRQAIGMMGVVASFLSIALAYILYPHVAKKQYLAMTAAVVLVSQFPTAILKARDVTFDLSPRMEERHGAWHNLYIGLGAVPNPFGIEWLDANGKQAVEKIDPNIEYLSAKYYATLRKEYFRILWQHPWEVLNIYYRKLMITLNTPLFRFLDVKWSLIGICVLFAASRWRVSAHWRTSDTAILVSLVFAGFFIGQSTLLHYDMQYLFPIYLFVLIGFGTAAESIFAAFIRIDDDAP
jgi:hypothetical protein